MVYILILYVNLHLTLYVNNDIINFTEDKNLCWQLCSLSIYF